MSDHHSFTQAVAEFSVVLLGSLVGWLAAALVHAVAVSSTLDFNAVGGSKTNIMFACVTGLPLGSVIGVVLAARIIRRNRTPNRLGLVVAVALTFCGLVVATAALDQVGGWTLPLFPVIVSACSQAGYWLGMGAQGRRIAGKRP